MRVLSLGAGVQSSTLLLMAVEGELEIDAAIFADTGWEPDWVYQHLAYLRAAAPGIPIHVVSGGNLRQDALAGVKAAWMPMYSVAPDTGKVQQLKRQCTRNYKIRPIRRKLRELCGGKPVEQLIGISLDEWQRARTSDVGYITNVHPLIDRQMKRHDCIAWLRTHGYVVPRKSSCIGCPLRRASGWVEIRSDPQAWANALDFDERIRMVRSLNGQPVFIHRDAQPLIQVDMRTPQERGQMDMFGEPESDGCGVLCDAELSA